MERDFTVDVADRLNQIKLKILFVRDAAATGSLDLTRAGQDGLGFVLQDIADELEDIVGDKGETAHSSEAA